MIVGEVFDNRITGSQPGPTHPRRNRLRRHFRCSISEGGAGGFTRTRGFSECPNRADYQWGKDPLEQLVVGSIAWRACGMGDCAVRNPATKSTFGGRAIRRAV